MKIAVVSCYKQTDYGRASTLRKAVDIAPDVELIDIRNTRRNALRYLEVIVKLLRTRWREKPDAYVITFRGYEMLLLAVMTGIRKPIIFDELVNFTEWMEEHSRLKPGSGAYRVFRWWYGRLTRHCTIILADTDAHAAYSAQLNALPLNRYRTVVVGADETIFQPHPSNEPNVQPFTIFYYGLNMLPLHGLSYVLQATIALKDNQNIKFHIVGGKVETKQLIEQAITQGARLTYDAWLPLQQLADIAAGADMALGGPFGNTLQSQYVITGKTYQSLAVGVPVIVGKNQVSGVFEDHKNCLLIPQADSPALTKAIVWAAKHPRELHQIGISGRLLYEKHFSQTIINKQIAAVLAELQKEH